jgi:hypothetical protein
MCPYVLQPDGPIVLLCPITPDIMLFGSTEMRPQFNVAGFSYSDLPDAGAVEAINHQICRFAYDTVFARTTGHEQLISETAGISPVFRTRVVATAEGDTLLGEMVFGKRQPKARWKPGS